MKALRHLSRLLFEPVRQQAKRLLAKANPTALAVQKAAFRASCTVDNLFLDHRLYDDKFLVRDLLAYPAAAAVVAVTPRVIWNRLEHQQTQGSRNDFQELVFQRASKWQQVLSPTGRSYRSLNRTLTEMPGRIPLYLLPSLAEVELERPVVDRVELIALLEATAYIEALRVNQEPPEEGPVVVPQAANARIFMHAKRSELCQAMQAVAAVLGCNLSTRRAEDIGSMTRYLMSYPEPHQGKIAGLTRKSIAWHRAGARYQVARLHDDSAVYLSSPTMRPPIELPTSPHLTWLDTAGAVYSEGDRMKHCVAQLANLAIAGGCYLFHCEYQDCHATIQVDRSGRVVEANGPRNHHNIAVEYGKKLLKKWGNALSEYSTPL